jgi:hypothetical protein
MTSITNLSRSEAESLKDQLHEILNKKELSQIQIVHTKGEILVSRSTEGLAPLPINQEDNDIHDLSSAD